MAEFLNHVRLKIRAVDDTNPCCSFHAGSLSCWNPPGSVPGGTVLSTACNNAAVLPGQYAAGTGCPVNCTDPMQVSDVTCDATGNWITPACTGRQSLLSIMCNRVRFLVWVLRDNRHVGRELEKRQNAASAAALIAAPCNLGSAHVLSRAPRMEKNTHICTFCYVGHVCCMQWCSARPTHCALMSTSAATITGQSLAPSALGLVM